jgi:hypothetical protein
MKRLLIICALLAAMAAQTYAVTNIFTRKIEYNVRFDIKQPQFAVEVDELDYDIELWFYCWANETNRLVVTNLTMAYKFDDEQYPEDVSALWSIPGTFGTDPHVVKFIPTNANTFASVFSRGFASLYALNPSGKKVSIAQGTHTTKDAPEKTGGALLPQNPFDWQPFTHTNIIPYFGLQPGSNLTFTAAGSNGWYVVHAYAGGAGAVTNVDWGDIGGALALQTDLSLILNARIATGTVHAAALGGLWASNVVRKAEIAALSATDVVYRAELDAHSATDVVFRAVDVALAATDVVYRAELDAHSATAVVFRASIVANAASNVADGLRLTAIETYTNAADLAILSTDTNVSFGGWTFLAGSGPRSRLTSTLGLASIYDSTGAAAFSFGDPEQGVYSRLLCNSNAGYVAAFYDVFRVGPVANGGTNILVYSAITNLKDRVTITEAATTANAASNVIEAAGIATNVLTVAAAQAAADSAIATNLVDAAGILTNALDILTAQATADAGTNHAASTSNPHTVTLQQAVNAGSGPVTNAPYMVQTNATDVTLGGLRIYSISGLMGTIMNNGAAGGQLTDNNNQAVLAWSTATGRQLANTNSDRIADFTDVFRVGPNGGTNLAVYATLTNNAAQIAALDSGKLDTDGDGSGLTAIPAAQLTGNAPIAVLTNAFASTTTNLLPSIDWGSLGGGSSVWTDDGDGTASYLAANTTATSVVIGGPAMGANAKQLAITNTTNGEVFSVDEDGDVTAAGGIICDGYPTRGPSIGEAGNVVYVSGLGGVTLRSTYASSAGQLQVGDASLIYSASAPVIFVGIGTNAPASKLQVVGAIASGYTAAYTNAGPTDNLDVSLKNSIFVDASGGNVTIGGLAGGVAGQVLRIVRIESANDVILEHAEGGGSQDIYLLGEADKTLSTIWRLDAYVQRDKLV